VKRPLDPDDVRALFQEVAPPPGVDRWRYAPAARARARRPRVSRRALAVAACVLAVAGVVGAVPATIRLVGARHAVPGGPSGHPPAQESPVPPAVSHSPAASGPATPGPGATAAPPARSGPGNTGVPTGTALRRYSGDLTVTTPGAVVDGLLVTGIILVEAPNVTIRRTRAAPARTDYWVIRQVPGATNLVIEDSEIAGGGIHIGVSQEADGLTVRRCAIHHVDTAIALGGASRGTVQDSYLHDVATGVGAAGGNATVTIRHNTILGTVPGEAAIGLADRSPPMVAVTIEDNLLGGGNYTFYAGGGSGRQQIRFSHNRFSRAASAKGGYYGPVAAWDATSPGNAWLDNVWDDTGAPVRP
jgi:hypothetical protein